MGVANPVRELPRSTSHAGTTVDQLPPDSMRLVRAVAHDISRRVPHADLDELMSAGAVGLMRALDRFDPARGLAFSTYAMSVIRGAMLDELRSRAWGTRAARSKARRIAAASHELTGRLGRGPAAREVAEHLGVDLGTYFEWQHAAETCIVVPLGRAGGAKAPLEERIPDANAVQPDEAVEWQETVGELLGAVEALPANQRRVISLYFHEQLTQREIAAVLGLSEGRVSQIRTAALRTLRAALGGAAERPEPRSQDHPGVARGRRKAASAPLEQRA